MIVIFYYENNMFLYLYYYVFQTFIVRFAESKSFNVII
jgi:hypothetical protein